MVVRESERAYQNTGANSRGHQEFAEILDNISNDNSTSMAEHRNERAAYKNYIEQEYRTQASGAQGADQSRKINQGSNLQSSQSKQELSNVFSTSIMQGKPIEFDFK